MGSIPNVGKDFSFFDSRMLCVPDSSTKPILTRTFQKGTKTLQKKIKLSMFRLVILPF